MNIRLLSPAQVELHDAVRFYDHQLPGLGFRFFKETEHALELIQFMPDAWPKIGDKTRRCLLKTFPYGILYVTDYTTILVTALAHLHRDPEHYEHRIE